VGIIIGAAIGKVVGALVDSILMPLVGMAMGGVDFSSLAIQVGEASVGYGAFLQAMIDFLIVAFVIFMIIKVLNNMKKSGEEEVEELSADTALLTEIRDLLKQR